MELSSVGHGFSSFLLDPPDGLDQSWTVVEDSFADIDTRGLSSNPANC